MAKQKHPLDSKVTENKLREAITLFAKGMPWDTYVYNMNTQDYWDDVIKTLGPETYAAFEKIWTSTGECPDQRTIKFFSSVEVVLYGTSVEENL